jgi:folylpolyglutamate synthase/dihydropteroate synthase
MKDKDVRGILKTLKPVAGKVWALTLPGGRAMPAEEISAAGTEIGMDIQPVAGIQPVFDWIDAEKKRLVCFTGSLYLPEELKKHGLFK